jgi:FAD/FMN-containing dehydrogenase/Fe-S oxidoreductase
VGVDLRMLEQLLRETVTGLVAFDPATRALYATDASNYRHVPLAVVIPRSTEEFAAAVTAARECGAPVALRGGGTSIAGQATGRGLVIDTSRHLRRIIEIDPGRRIARVEPGVVLDDLRSAAAHHGLTFGPDPSTHNRCTIGGMIGNNACGAHSLAWGTTADNVEDLDVLLYDGRRISVGAGLESVQPAAGDPGQSDHRGSGVFRGGLPDTAGSLPDTLEGHQDFRGRLPDRSSSPKTRGGSEGFRGSLVNTHTVDGLRSALARFQQDHLALMRTGLPQLPRRCSGYLVDWLLPERGAHVARSLVGTEGTCAVVLGATVRLVDAPAARCLLVLGYPDVCVAADHAPGLLANGPLAVEAMERALIARVSSPPAELPGGGAWLYVEFGGADEAEATARANEAAAAAGASSYTIVTQQDRQRALWQLREHGVGWATRLPADGPDDHGGREKARPAAARPATAEYEAWPGWEDAAVPPAQLGAYLRAFKALLAEHHLRGPTYGHFGEGCVHIRVDFDLLTAAGRGRFRRFIEEAADLVVAHGGVPSGEHGDGQARAELQAKVFGRPVVAMFEGFKALWDPTGQLNPGVGVRPRPLDVDLSVTGPTAALRRHGGLALAPDGGDLARATRRCVGVAACRAESGGVMCPSFRVTHDDRHSTRGRARLLAEMLRGDLVTAGWRSPEVREALDLCLACKGCLSDCPVNVDMASYKAEFLHHHYRGRPRPRSHYALGWLPVWLRAAGRMPHVVNSLFTGPGARAMAALAGITRERPLPRLAARSLLAECGPGGDSDGPEVAADHRVGGEGLGPDRLEHVGNGQQQLLDSETVGQPVLLWPDTFTNYFAPSVGSAALTVLTDAGLRPQLPDGAVCCGLTFVSTGQLGMARRILRRSLDTVASALDDGLPIVGLEPSCTASLRTDAIELLPRDPRARQLASSVRTLSEVLSLYAPSWPDRWRANDRHSARGEGQSHGADASTPPPQPAVVQRHCHQYAVLGFDADADLMRRVGIAADVLDAGCCGLAGNFGYEHYDTAMAVGELAVLPAVRAAAADALVIADGFSCRLQIAHATGRHPIHLAEALAAILDRHT